MTTQDAPSSIDWCQSDSLSCALIMATNSSSSGTNVSGEELQDCPIDSKGDLEDPNNLFTCKASESCCTVDLNPACCAKKDMGDEIKDQLVLWGPLLGVILILAFVIWLCRSDESCCDVERPWLYRFGCKKKKDEEESVEDVTSSQLSLKSGNTATFMIHDDGVAGHDAAELELAADNLEEHLEEETEEGEAKEEENASDDNESDDDDDDEEDEDDNDDDDDDEKKDN